MSEIDRIIPSRDTYNSLSLSNSSVTTTTSRNVLIQSYILAKMSVPVIFAFLLGASARCITLYFAHRLSHETGNTSLFAGISLALTFVNDGITTAVETLSSQHNGALHYNEVGNILNRCVIVLFLIALPVVGSWFYASEFFFWVGGDRAACDTMYTFISIRSLSVPADIIWLAYEKYLMSMGMMNPSFVTAIVYNGTLIAVEYAFVGHFEWGVEGLAYAVTLCNYWKAFVLVFVSCRHPYVQRTLHAHFSQETWRTLWEFSCFALSGCVMVCAEWWAYEIVTIFASLVGSYAVSSITIAQQLIAIAFIFPLGIGIAASTLVGTALGANKCEEAKQMGSFSLKFMMCLSILISPTVYLAANKFFHVYSADALVLQTCAQLVFWLALSSCLDAMQCVASGILRGAGKQHVGAVLNLIAFYIFGLPVSYWACFRLELGVKGLLIGLVIGSGVQVIVMLCIVVGMPGFVYSEMDSVKAVDSSTALYLSPMLCGLDAYPNLLPHVDIGVGGRRRGDSTSTITSVYL